MQPLTATPRLAKLRQYLYNSILIVSRLSLNDFLKILQQWLMKFWFGLFDRAVIELIAYQILVISIIVSTELHMSEIVKCIAHPSQLSARGTYYHHLYFTHWPNIGSLSNFCE